MASNQAQCGFNPTLGFFIQKSRHFFFHVSLFHYKKTSYVKAPQATRYGQTSCQLIVHQGCKNIQATLKHLNQQGLSMPYADRGGEGGDRQWREKGPPILTAEKGEHERAQSVSDSYPTPLRATLRAPPSKWAVEAFFPESPCRWLSFAHFSFAIERKV